MAETTNPAFPELGVLCPLSVYDTEEAAVAHWREVAQAQGHTPTGPLTVVLVPVPEGQEVLYGGDQCWRVSGEVAPQAPPVPLPTFVPSKEAVEAAAAKIGRELDPSLVWEQAPAHVKNYYCRLALAGLNAAGQHLVADAAAHVAQYASSYGAQALIAQPQLRALTDEVRTRLNEWSDL